MKTWHNDFSWMRGHVNFFSNDLLEEIYRLNYFTESFNDSVQLDTWKQQGFIPRTGSMYDMRNNTQPRLSNLLSNYVSDHNLEFIGISYYKMKSGDNLPYHSDLYSKYISVYNLMARKKNIIRYIFFPEDRKPGHIFEIDGNFIDYKAGDYVAWRYDTPHLAANLGLDDRYSIQVTGILRENIK